MVCGNVLAHNPAVGVNVYVFPIVLLNAGLHVPVIPFVEVVGNAFKVPPLQIAVGSPVNVGTNNDVITTVAGGVVKAGQPPLAAIVYITL
jgi:hypothetical protein